jgi:hypothetical protein
VAYLNGSKVLTTGSALTFDGSTFGVTGAATVTGDISTTSTGRLNLRGSATGVNNDFQLDNSDTLVNFRATRSNAITKGYVWFLDNSTNEAMRLTNTGLGIGTSSPSFKQHTVVAGATGDIAGFGLSGNANDPLLLIKADATNQVITFRGGSSTTTYPAIAFDTGTGGEKMRLDSSGNLGLGVTPSAWQSGLRAFQVGATASIYSNGSNTTFHGLNFFTDSGGTNKYLISNFASAYGQISGAHSWYTAPSGTAGDAISFTQAMTLTAAGDLGVGTTSPINNGGYGGFSLNGTSGALLSMMTAGTESSRIASLGDLTSIQCKATTGYITFVQGVSGGTERARITSGGELLVGDTTNSRAARLRVEGAETAYFTGYGSGYGIGLWMTPNASASGGNATAISFQNVSNSTVGSITTSASATLYNVTSDQRLKENIVNADSASSLIDSLQVRQFDWKADSTHQRYGFVAQELVTVAPEAVYQPTDTEEMMAVDYSKLVPMLVKEIQSLRARVAQLETN